LNLFNFFYDSKPPRKSLKKLKLDEENREKQRKTEENRAKWRYYKNNMKKLPQEFFEKNKNLEKTHLIKK
jgi:hypothetical protein